MINESISTLRILHLILIYISQQKDVRSILGIVVTLYSKVCCQLKTYLITNYDFSFRNIFPYISVILNLGGVFLRRTLETIA